VQEPGGELFWNWVKSHIPALHASESWEQVAEMMTIITANPQVFALYREDIYKQWCAWKAQMQTAITEVINAPF
jgi:hypothetical protein